MTTDRKPTALSATLPLLIGAPSAYWFYTETSGAALAALFLLLWANNLSIKAVIESRSHE